MGGFTVSDLDSYSNRVYVDYVVPDGWAHYRGIDSGDEIVGIDDLTTTADDFFHNTSGMSFQETSEALGKRPILLEIFKKAIWKKGDEAILQGLGESEPINEGQKAVLIEFVKQEWKVSVLEGGGKGEILMLPTANLAPVDSKQLRKKYGISPPGTEGNLLRLREQRYRS